MRYIRIYVYTHIQFLRTSSVIFLHVMFTETESFAKCHLTSWTYKTGDFFWFVCWTNSAPAMVFFFFFFSWWSLNHYMNFESHPVDVQLDPSLTVLCIAMVSVLLTLRLVIHRVPYLCCFLSWLCRFLNTVHYEVLESLAFVLLI